MAKKNRIIRSRVKENKPLLKIARGMERDTSRDINQLMLRFNNRNDNPGIGTHQTFNDIYELRARNGGRVYYRRIDEDSYEILAYSEKHTQDRVINILREKYS